MRHAFLGGVSLVILSASPAVARGAPPSPQAVLDRLSALEARVSDLEARNGDLQRQLAAARQAAGSAIPAGGVALAAAAGAGQPAIAAGTGNAPLPAAASGGRGNTQSGGPGTPAVVWSIVPQFNSPDGNFSLKPRGILDVDYAGFNERRGGYDFNDGTQVRRGRFGFDGTILKQLAWRVEAEYVGGTVSLLDAYVAYTGKKDFTLTLGQVKVPAGLEANSSDSFNEFMERGMANTAFGAVGGERRVGVTLAYANPIFTATGGVYGSNESISRNAASPDEVWGYNGRITAEPINAPGRLIHVGASAYHVKDITGKDLTVGDRPNVRVDNGSIEAVTFSGASTTAATAGARDATFYGFEGAGILGPVSVQGEYSHLRVDRVAGRAAADFDGWYAFASLFLTGETRTFKGGVIDRLKPLRPFDPLKGSWGAFEVAARYDRLNLTDSALSPLDHDAHSITGALNWYLTGNVKLLFNYIRFTGQNSPLVRTPVSIFGTTVKGDAFATRLHLDF